MGRKKSIKTTRNQIYSLLNYTFLMYYVFLKVSSILYQEHTNFFFLNPDLCGLSWIQELSISGEEECE